MDYMYERMFRQAQPIAQSVVGLRVPCQREQELYDGIDRELTRIRAARELRIHYEGQ